jgi:antitoxin MazE
MRTNIRKWGNSPALRLPAAIMEQAGLSIDAVVDLRVEQNRIVIAPMPADDDLDIVAMSERITPENRYDAVDFGPALGKEVW